MNFIQYTLIHISNMNTESKLSLLSDGARYDISCACGDKKVDKRTRIGDGRWLYPVSLPNGGQSIIFKVLMTNACENDCGYCPFRSDSNVPRCSLSPEEVVAAFLEYSRRLKLAGIFVSSGVVGNPDSTMERILDVGRVLRKRHGYRGYIHLKVIPGASDAAIAEAVSLGSAVSINLEAPGERRFEKICGTKNYLEDVIRPLKTLSGIISAIPPGPRRPNTTTQFVVGASDETDLEIIRYMTGLYDRMGLHRVYFSAYQRGLGRGGIPGEQCEDTHSDKLIIREHRLYQTDFLMRKYGFSGDEIPVGPDGALRLDKDPKEVWAEAHPEFFPVDLNSACKEELLRVPGLGPSSVRAILTMRRHRKLTSLEDAGIRGARLAKASPYTTPSSAAVVPAQFEQLDLFQAISPARAF